EGLKKVYVVTKEEELNKIVAIAKKMALSGELNEKGFTLLLMLKEHTKSTTITSSNKGVINFTFFDPAFIQGFVEECVESLFVGNSENITHKTYKSDIRALGSKQFTNMDDLNQFLKNHQTDKGVIVNKKGEK